MQRQSRLDSPGVLQHGIIRGIERQKILRIRPTRIIFWIVCQEDAYLKALVRYIHLNPLRAKIVADLKGLYGYPAGMAWFYSPAKTPGRIWIMC